MSLRKGYTSAARKSHFGLRNGPESPAADHGSRVVRLNPHHPRLRTSSISFVCSERLTQATICEQSNASTPASSKSAIKLDVEVSIGLLFCTNDDSWLLPCGVIAGMSGIPLTQT